MYTAATQRVPVFPLSFEQTPQRLAATHEAAVIGLETNVNDKNIHHYYQYFFAFFVKDVSHEAAVIGLKPMLLIKIFRSMSGIQQESGDPMVQQKLP